MALRLADTHWSVDRGRPRSRCRSCTVWATIKSADREIAASKAQTAVAQEQLARTLRLERRRVVRESYAFFAMVAAAMGAILADVKEVRKIMVQARQHAHRQEEAGLARDPAGTVRRQAARPER